MGHVQVHYTNFQRMMIFALVTIHVSFEFDDLKFKKQIFPFDNSLIPFIYPINIFLNLIKILAKTWLFPHIMYKAYEKISRSFLKFNVVL